MRGRYTASDNSIDFNIMDHKGSIKYVINEWRPGINTYIRTLLMIQLYSPAFYLKFLWITIFAFYIWSLLDGPDFEGTFEVAGPREGRGQQRSRLPIDAKIKLKHARTKTGRYDSPLDPHDIVLSFVNNYRHDANGEWRHISMPSMEMRGKLRFLVEQCIPIVI